MGIKLQNYINNYHKKQSETKEIRKTFYTQSVATLALAAIPILAITEKISKIQKELTKDEVEIVNNALDDIISNKTNLGQKGVKIEHVASSISSAKFPNNLFKYFSTAEQFAQGRNACFMPKRNIVKLNRDKAPILGLHELGHAFNANNSVFLKTMQKTIKYGKLFALGFAFLPILTKEEKAYENKELTKKQKFKNILRKASPLLAFISFIPTLTEEAIASIRGCAWAKELLNKDLYKKVAKTNAIAYVSYLLTALSFSALALVGKLAKDKKSNLKKTKTIGQTQNNKNIADFESFKLKTQNKKHSKT